MLKYEKYLKSYSRELRKNMTETERLIWSRIRGRQLRGYQFYRQKPIGNFIVDFYCPKAHLVIELDGGQHYHGECKAKDSMRDIFLNELGLKVLRFSDRDVLEDLTSVLEAIWKGL